eukprot:scaffold33139_cov152-Isochrysis_galbana.AAC.4
MERARGDASDVSEVHGYVGRKEAHPAYAPCHPQPCLRRDDTASHIDRLARAAVYIRTDPAAPAPAACIHQKKNL